MNPDGMGLVSAGGVNQSFLSRLPSLLARISQIKASSYRVARQLANSLRAGTAAAHYSALGSCPAIFVSVPEAQLPATLRDLVAQAPLGAAPHTRTMVVLCGCIHDSVTPSPLHATGARVASINPIPGSGERIFVAEGHRDTLRMLKGILSQDGRKMIELKPGTKPLFFAGVHVAAPLLLPWIAGGMECLRAAGFSRSEAAMVGEFLGVHALHGYARAGSRVWNRQTAAGLRRALEHDLPAIRSWNVRLARLYEQGIQVALGAFRDQQEAPELSNPLPAARRARTVGSAG